MRLWLQKMQLLDYIVPDFVHIVMDGRVVKSGDKDLAKKIAQDT